MNELKEVSETRRVRKTDKMIAAEYFETVADLLSYEMNGENRAVCEAVLQLLARVYGAEDRYEACLRFIRESDGIESASDAELLTGNAAGRSLSADLKLEILTEKGIVRQRRFDADLAVREISEKAFRGEKSACKLLAALRYLGVIVGRSVETAVTVWETLAMSGDPFALSARIYAERENGEIPESSWEEVREILDSAEVQFLPVVAPIGRDYSLEARQRAELILFFRQRGGGERNGRLDRRMLYYALYGKADYMTKLENLSSERNYSLLLQYEESRKTARCGF